MTAMPAPYILLSIDYGTQSVRALLFDLHGNLVAKAQVAPRRPTYSDQPGWAEHDAEGFWKPPARAPAASCGAIGPSVARRGVRGVGRDHAARHGDATSTREGQPLRSGASSGSTSAAPTQRAAASARPGARRSGSRGVGGTIDYFQREAEVNWIGPSTSPRSGRAPTRCCCCPGFLN